ncbi:protein ABHD4-like isoform X1, partial [Argonauta hians]
NTWFSWRPTSKMQLSGIEHKIFQCVKTKMESLFVPIRNGECRIRTVVLNKPPSPPPPSLPSPDDGNNNPSQGTQGNAKEPGVGGGGGGFHGVGSGEGGGGGGGVLPLVMVHGMGGGVGMWVMNLDRLAEAPSSSSSSAAATTTTTTFDTPSSNPANTTTTTTSSSAAPAPSPSPEPSTPHLLAPRGGRPVYAFDVLGFGRSSRPRFAGDARRAEEEFVDSIEEWRREMGLERFILLGHSLGSFLATSYAIRHPDRVHHLIAVEPWGFPEKPDATADNNRNPTQRLSFWARALINMARPFNPFAALRAAGPWGPGLVKKFRSDLQLRFSKLFDDDTILDYLYHCNAQTPSGESAFRTMTIPFGWAKNPMIARIGELDRSVPMTLIYGSRSWITSHTGQDVKYLRPHSYVDVQVIQGAGHHVYADRCEEFNELVREVCSMADREGVEGRWGKGREREEEEVVEESRDRCQRQRREQEQQQQQQRPRQRHHHHTPTPSSPPS